MVHEMRYRRLDREEKMSNSYPKELRERVIQEWLDGASKAAAAARFKVGYATARRWIDRYQTTGSYLAFPDSGGKSTQKIFEEHEQAILSWVRDNPSLTQLQICKLLADHFDLSVCQATISNTLARLNQSCKKTFQDDRATTPQNLARRRIYKFLVTFLFAHCYERMVWVDETGFRTHMTRTRGWCTRGKRLRFKHRKKTSPYTLVCAMGFDGIVGQWVFPKGLTKKRWRTFSLERLLESLEPNCIILWDNLGIHYMEDVRRALKEAGHAVYFTPPYSPEGNPIEYMFSKLKTFVRKQCPNSAKTLRAAIAQGLETITKNDIASGAVPKRGRRSPRRMSPRPERVSTTTPAVAA